MKIIFTTQSFAIWRLILIIILSFAIYVCLRSFTSFSIICWILKQNFHRKPKPEKEGRRENFKFYSKPFKLEPWGNKIRCCFPCLHCLVEINRFLELISDHSLASPISLIVRWWPLCCLDENGNNFIVQILKGYYRHHLITVS